jgi:hypothetical protein
VPAATLIPQPTCLHSVILAGPPSSLSDRIATALRGGGLTVLRTSALGPGACEALVGATGCVIVVVAQTSDIADESCRFMHAAPPSPILRVIGGRLMSAICPNGDVGPLLAMLSGAGVNLSVPMSRALGLIEPKLATFRR